MMNRDRLLVVIGCLLAMVGGFAATRTIAGDSHWRTTIDFGLYLQAAKDLAAGQSAYAHTEAEQFFGTTSRDGYAYPPFLAWCFVPLLGLGDGMVRGLWTCASIAAFFASVVMLAQLARLKLTWPALGVLLGAVTLSRWWRGEVYHGQVNWLLLFLLVLGIRECARGRATRAAIFWALVIAVKPFVVVLALWLAWRKEWKAAAIASLGGAALIGASFALSPVSFAGFLDSMAYYSSAAGAGGRPDNIALHGLWQRLFEENPYSFSAVHAPLLVKAFDAVTAAALVLLFVRAYPRSSIREPLLEIGMVMLSATLLGPLSNGSHLWLALPGLFGAWRLAAWMGGPRDRWLAYAWTALFAMRLSPVRLNVLNAFGSLDGSSWEQATLPAALLTGSAAAVMIGVLCLHTSRPGPG